ncbi:serine hydrolase [Chitinophaga pinensis]|uniref:Beta-lactamase n=1 Tax=Chitinophaga pinensis (strain ATCC 43595 / DSM 2588 / LMG 13176 / NBRC 15968 / NCIMB 11800 / UQM 2034) TaxID=485918 RepID=A0A979GB95_CHIPD|nr:serine hydrolase [Chitinophaga pinensis]ACU64178.1 beta-lactamase [Chitinophaga pinensis DSM 2588]
MKKLLCLGLILGSLHNLFAQDTTAKLDSLVSAYSGLHKFNGTVLVTQKGNILLDKAYGYQRTADSIRNETGTIFQLGSVTKQFTATVILKLAEEHKLSIQDKLSKYFPDYPKGDSITIENLLTHTSGIFNYTNDKDFMDKEVSNPASREKIMALFKDKPLNFSPGTKWDYSNSGYSMLGYIIEKVTGKPYEQVVRKYIFTPLHMDHTGFDFKNLKDRKKSTGYFNINDSSSTLAPSVDSSVSFAAGAMYSTTADLYKWHQAAQQYKIISKTDWEKAYTPFMNHYGYGWESDSIAGKRKVSHGGGIHGYITSIMRVPEDDVCVIVLDNASDRDVSKIASSLLAVLYNQPYIIPKERIAIKLPETTLQQYVGEYNLRPGFNIVMSVKDGMLMGQPTGQRESPLFAEKEDFFFLKIVDAQVGFTRNEQHEVTGMILYQNDRELPGKKIK